MCEKVEIAMVVAFSVDLRNVRLSQRATTVLLGIISTGGGA